MGLNAGQGHGRDGSGKMAGMGECAAALHVIARAARVFDGLRADALPRAQTRDLLEKAGERWLL
jgi:hypothetical protein